MIYYLKIFITTTLIAGLVSCKYSSSCDRVVLKKFNRNNTNLEDSLILCRTLNNNGISFTYMIGNDTLDYSFKLKSIDSILQFGNKYRLVNHKSIKIEDEMFSILKYECEEEGALDGKSIIYITKEYGILVVYNLNWFEGFLYEQDLNSRILIDSIKNEETFFDFS